MPDEAQPGGAVRGEREKGNIFLFFFAFFFFFFFFPPIYLITYEY